jgi:hypothetical protein
MGLPGRPKRSTGSGAGPEGVGNPVACVFDHYPHGSFADLWGVPILSFLDPILSYDGVSGNPGAVQYDLHAGEDHEVMEITCRKRKS